MAKIENVNIDYFWKWEGGLSKDPRDPAAKFPVPDGKGFHTNKGVTWRVFSTNAKKLGYPATPTHFYEMPKATWLKIYKQLFWDGVKADAIVSQAIAEFMADWAWGSGPGTAAKKLQAFLNTRGANLLVDGKIGALTLGFFNNLIQHSGERIVFEDLDRSKRNFLKTTSGFKTYGLGWYNRMDDFRDYAVSIIPAAP